MAEENELEMDKGGKSKKMLIIIIVAVVVILGGVGAFFFFSGDDDGVTEEQMNAELASNSSMVDGDAGESSDTKLGTAIYVTMPRPFRFNVPGASRDRFVEIRAQLLVRGVENEEEAKKHIPLIESSMLNVFSQSNADDLSTSAGKTALKQLTLTEIQKEMNELSGRTVVEQVLFTGFVMQ